MPSINCLIPVNEKIACVPPESTQIKVKVQGGFGRVEQKTQLTGLRVLFGNELARGPRVWAPTGCTVYVSGESLAAHQWAKQIYEHMGQKFIMVPEAMVVLVDPSGGSTVVSTTAVDTPVEPTLPMIKEIP